MHSVAAIFCGDVSPRRTRIDELLREELTLRGGVLTEIVWLADEPPGAAREPARVIDDLQGSCDSIVVAGCGASEFSLAGQERVIVLGPDADQSRLVSLLDARVGPRREPWGGCTLYGVEPPAIREVLDQRAKGGAAAYLVTGGRDEAFVVSLASEPEDPCRVLADRFGAERLADGIRSLAQTVLEEMAGRELQLAAAESCTGGRLAAEVTAVPGSSTAFWGSLVTYSYEAKTTLLGVPQATLERHGAVSEQVVVEMARGLRTRSGVDICLSISGIAGPGGGTREKPVGTVWLACDATGLGTTTRLLHLGGDREQIQRDSVRESLVLARAAVAAVASG